MAKLKTMHPQKAKFLGICRYTLIGILMLAIFTCSISFLIFFPAEIEDKTVSGLQLRSQKWSGTIKIDGDVIFPPLFTLTILPGTKIYFDKLSGINISDTEWGIHADDFIKEKNDPTGRKGYKEAHFGIYGKIIAVGTKEMPIVFTSSQKIPEYADWDELMVFEGSRFEYANISYSHNGINIAGKNVVIKNSIIQNSLWSCIDVYSSGNLIENNEIFHCWHQVIGAKREGEHEITSNYIHDSQLS